MGQDLYLLLATTAFASIAAIFSVLAFLAARQQRESTGASGETAQVIRTEADRIRTESNEQARAIRQELSENLRGFQTAILQAFTELGRQLGEQVRDFGAKLDGGLRLIEERAIEIGGKLDQGLGHFEQRAREGRDLLGEIVTARLDDSTSKSTAAARELREEVLYTVKVACTPPARQI